MAIVTLGIDLAKNVFALHGVDATQGLGHVVSVSSDLLDGIHYSDVLVLRQHLWSHNRGALVRDKERVELISTVQTCEGQPAHELENRYDCAQCHGPRLTFGTLQIYPHADWAERTIEVNRRISKAVVNEANVGNLEVTRRVSNRGIAATRIPAKHALVSEGHASKYFDSMGERYVLGKGRYYVRAAHLVQDLASSTQEVRIGLTVLAVADASAHLLGVADVAPERAASAA